MIKRTIKQDGVNIDIVITLTSEEKEAIYREKERKYLKDDIDNLIQQDEDLSEAIDIKNLNDHDIEEISSDFHDRLVDYDTYWNIHWHCLSKAILEYLKK